MAAQLTIQPTRFAPIDLATEPEERGEGSGLSATRLVATIATLAALVAFALAALPVRAESSGAAIGSHVQMTLLEAARGAAPSAF